MRECGCLPLHGGGRGTGGKGGVVPPHFQSLPLQAQTFSGQEWLQVLLQESNSTLHSSSYTSPGILLLWSLKSESSPVPGTTS